MPWDILDYEGRTVGEGAAYMPPYGGWYDENMVILCNKVITGCNDIIPCATWWNAQLVIKCDSLLIGCNEVIPCQA